MNKARVIEVIEEMNGSDVVSMWNEYALENSYNEDYIYGMYELDDMFYGRSATDLLNALGDGFSLNDDYFRDSIYGLDSFSDIYDVVCVDDLAGWLVDNHGDGGVSEIIELFDEDEDEED